MTTQLKPCHFCGLQSHEDWDDTIYTAGIGWRDEVKDTRYERDKALREASEKARKALEKHGETQ